MNRFAFLERKRVEDAETDAETETAADVLAFGRFQAESEGGLAANFFLRAAEAESAPLKCVLMSLGVKIDFALSCWICWLANLFFELALDLWI